MIYGVANEAVAIHTGVRVGSDSGRYIAGGQAILAGRFSDGPPGYRGYEVVVALCEWLGVGLAGVIGLQVLAASCSVVALYWIGCRIAGDRAGVAAVALQCLNIDTARWHSYVLTESLYTSGLVLTVWATHWATRSSEGSANARARRYVLAALVLLATASVRPEGVVLVPVVVTYWVTRVVSTPSPRRVALAAATFAAVSGIVSLVSVSSARYGTRLAADATLLREGFVVYGYDGWRVPMPTAAAAAETESHALGAVSYVVRHPVAYGQLALARVGAELAHVRPFHSTRHNVIALLALLPLYGLAVVGGLRARDRAIARLLVAVVVAHLAIVAVTFADWDGRFLSHVLPLVIALAASGLAVLSRARAWAIGPTGQAQPSGRSADQIEHEQ
jgi:hypothetical protein